LLLLAPPSHELQHLPDRQQWNEATRQDAEQEKAGKPAHALQFRWRDIRSRPTLRAWALSNPFR